MTHTVFIDGAAGTTGLEIAERLAGRSEFTLVALDDARRKDPAARAEALNSADFAVLCLPEALPPWLAWCGLRVSVLSATCWRRAWLLGPGVGFVMTAVQLQAGLDQRLAMALEGQVLQVWMGEQRATAKAVFDDAGLHLFQRGRHYRFELHDPLSTTATGVSAHAGGLNAPMPGRIVELLAMPDAPVTKGTALLVLEAMKMEHTLLAPSDGVVRQFLVKAGDLVADGATLLDFEQV